MLHSRNFRQVALLARYLMHAKSTWAARARRDEREANDVRHFAFCIPRYNSIISAKLIITFYTP